MLYQIITEDMNRAGIQSILDARFPAYTLLPASGHWQGVSEPSLVIEVDTADRSQVDSAAEAIRLANHQDAVLIEAIPSDSQLVT